MIQPLVIHASEAEGGAQRACDRAAAHLAAWLAHYHATLIGPVQLATNLVVSVAGQVTYHVTVGGMADVPGDTYIPSADPRDPAEWRALEPPAIRPAAPGSTREDVDAAQLVAAGAPPPTPPVPEALAAAHQEIRTLMEALRWKPEHASAFLWKWQVHRIRELDMRGAQSMLAALRKKAAEVA